MTSSKLALLRQEATPRVSCESRSELLVRMLIHTDALYKQRQGEVTATQAITISPWAELPPAEAPRTPSGAGTVEQQGC